jgi:hypothetical protein
VQSPFFGNQGLLVENAGGDRCLLQKACRGSFRIEETFIIRPDGPELVTTFQLEVPDRYAS